jgi:hypothetical protein
MKIFGWVLIVAGFVISGMLYYFMNVDQQTYMDTSFWLIEEQTTLGFPLWLSGIALIGLGIFLHRSTKASAVESSPTILAEGSASQTQPSFSPPSEPSPDGGTLSVDSVDESVFMDDWMLHVHSEIKGTLLPTGAQIVQTPTNGVQLGLILTRTTPQGTKQALHAMSEMLSKIPTPPRVRIELLDVMATGVPMKNIAIGGLSKFFAKQDFIITEQIDGLDIRFNRPDECWTNT